MPAELKGALRHREYQGAPRGERRQWVLHPIFRRGDAYRCGGARGDAHASKCRASAGDQLRRRRKQTTGAALWNLAHRVFLNTPQGLEQGFVIARRDERAGSALHIRLTAAGGWSVNGSGRPSAVNERRRHA